MKSEQLGMSNLDTWQVEQVSALGAVFTWA